MKTYTAKTPIDYGNGKDKPARRYEIGETIEVDDQSAEQLLAIKAIEPHDPKAAFQDAVRKAESAGRELEKAGIDPSEAAHELRVRERAALAEAIEASAVMVVAGAISVDAAAEQICAQLASATHADVVSRLEERVAQLNKGPATATSTSSAPANTASAEPKGEAKDKKKR